ncbi:PstS family phosphate ABC transporter substrate-binding protein [Nonomuraea purpurea]|uniref:PstS family phosphate ABC transporter substrate-binding protein n=1 Tax=Nonomuraea purpurea TaxID=1849276 RepID=A0ABV8GJB6_9ACTN
MALLELLGQLVDFLGGVGPVLFGIVLLIAAPFFDRLVVRRKRISFRVLYNSKIGVGPEGLSDSNDPAEATPPQLLQVARLLERMSIVVIRLRNSGSYDIDADDFEKPLSFRFGGRVVWNARVSEATTDQLRAKLREGLRFFPEDDNPDRDTLVTVRERLTVRMARWLGGGPSVPDSAEPLWHGVRLDGLKLKRGEKAKLVVVLRESGRGEITKVVEHAGKLKDAGMIKDEGENRRITLPRVSAGLVIVLSAVLVLSQLGQPQDRTIACASGDLRVVGSSVVMPTMKAIARDYADACGNARITTEATGSVEGTRAALQSAKNDVIALSDGKSGLHDQLHSEKLATVVFYVVVNSGVGLTTITREDLHRINAGEVTDWKQLRDGPSLPIRIISRGPESGTRQLYEHRVLGTGENVLSSDECREKDRNPGAPVIRCERGDNAEVIQQVATVPGAIGYADALSIADQRKAGAITALTLDGKAFDPADAAKAGYPFWTVEYLYSHWKPEPGSLAAGFLGFVRTHERAQLRLSESGFLPCTTKQGLAELCVLR